MAIQIPLRSVSGCRPRHRSLARVVAAAGAAALSLALACGGSSASQTGTATVTVTLRPSGTVPVGFSGSVPFTAAVSGSGDTGVTWAVEGVPGGNGSVGTITGTGATVAYTAPAAPGAYMVTATSTADAGASASTQVIVQAAPVSISLIPAGPVAVPTGGTQAFTATVTGPADTSVSWYVDGIAVGSSAAGTISGSGATVTYTAPASAGSHTVTATSVADASKSASAIVNVTVPVVQVALNPSGTVSVVTSGTQSFTATVTGSSNTAVTWAVDGFAGGNSSVGAITGTGATVTYTAPAATGTHTVTATSAADGSKAAAATVSVQAPAAVKVTLSWIGPANIVVSGATLFTATVSNASDTTVTWSVDGVVNGDAGTGTIRAPVPGNQVVYLAPAALGTHTVTATSRADPGKSASIGLVVTAAAIQTGSIPVGANVRDAAYGAAGDGATDDTAAINRAVRAVAGTGRAVYVPAGTYMINATANNGAGILLGGNMALVLDPGATFKAFPTSTMHYVLVKADRVSNLLISGGTYIGNNDDNSIPTPTTTEDGTGIEILGCSNVVVEGVVTEKCFCDGLYIADASRDVVIRNAASLANRRHGMAIVNATGVAVLGSTFSGNTGSVEQSGGPWVNGCGIDIEANANEDISDILVYGCTFTGNHLAGLGWGVGNATASGSSTGGIFVIGNTATGNGHGLDAENCPNSAILDNDVEDNPGYGIYIHDGATGTVCTGNTVRNTGSSGDGAGIMCYNDTGTRVDSNTSTGNARYGIYAVQSTGTTITNNTATGNGAAGIYVTRSTGVTQYGNVTQ